jgi:diadenosine tetraphosphate (Ap4A) HIT family hydrolase
VQKEPWDVVASLDASWLTMPEGAPVRGYACLVSKLHVVEIHELPEEAATLFWKDARKVSRSLARATGAVKLNYEIHGNTLPHLHMHFFPRYSGDAFEGRPIDPKSVSGPVYRAGEFATLRQAVLEGLANAA